MRTRFGHRLGALTAALLLPLLFAGAATAGPIRPLPGKIDARLADRIAKTDGNVLAWVFFDDRGSDGPPAPVTSRALARRAKVGYAPGVGDRLLPRDYVAAVEAAGGEVRSRSRWLRGVSVIASPRAIRRIASLDFVIRIQEVARIAPPPAPETGPPAPRPPATKRTNLDYGRSFYQLDQMNAIPLLEQGYTGAGVIVMMLDSGFYTGAPCFAGMDIEDRYDFVHNDTTVSNETPSESILVNVEVHGSATLSVIGGYDPGEIVGPAFGATYLLAKTEDSENYNEYPGEEDLWIRGIEWGESLGVDVASSSVGYVDWYTYADMDGATAVITLGAQAAVDRGVVVVNAQGNEANTFHYMIAPADARGVISVGAATISGNRASFSSFGPTFDGRIKPDVSAMGVGVAGVGVPRSESPYSEFLSGTSFSCPLVAGTAALLLQVHPSMTPALVMEALKATASQAADPDNSLGWGIVDAYAAALRPVVIHDPALDAAWNGSSGYDVDLELSLFPGFDSLQAVFGDEAVFTDTADLEPVDPGATYRFTLTSAAGGAHRYFFRFVRGDTVLTIPDDAPEAYYEIGDATPPVITHTPIPDWPIQQWPAEIVAVVRDNVGVDEDSVTAWYSTVLPEGGTGHEGGVALTRRDDSTFAANFDFTAVPGERVSYYIEARDAAGNRARFPAGSEVVGFDAYSIGYALHYAVTGESGPSNPFLSGAGEGYPIFFDLPERQNVRVRVYDVAGRLVRTIRDEPAGPGKNLRVTWDGKDREGRRVSSGVYFLRFEAGPFATTRKFVVIR